MVPLKYLSNLWRTLEMPLINCEVNLVNIVLRLCHNLHKCFKSNSYILQTNLYVPVVTLSTQDNAKIFPQLKSGFKRTIS